MLTRGEAPTNWPEHVQVALDNTAPLKHGQGGRTLGIPPSPGRCQILTANVPRASPAVRHEPIPRAVTIEEPTHQLVLQLRLDRGCALDRVEVDGRDVVSSGRSVTTGVKVGGRWHTSANDLPQAPKVSADSDEVVVSDIAGGGGGVKFVETWRFTSLARGIRWRIDRRYLAGGQVDEVALPEWDFNDMPTWTGALLGNGGVGWPKLFDRTNATYGVHAVLA